MQKCSRITLLHPALAAAAALHGAHFVLTFEKCTAHPVRPCTGESSNGGPYLTALHVEIGSVVSYLLPPYNGEAQTRGQSMATIGPAVQSSTLLLHLAERLLAPVWPRGAHLFAIFSPPVLPNVPAVLSGKKKIGPPKSQLRRHVWAANGGLLDPS